MPMNGRRPSCSRSERIIPREVHMRLQSRILLRRAPIPPLAGRTDCDALVGVLAPLSVMPTSQLALERNSPS